MSRIGQTHCKGAIPAKSRIKGGRWERLVVGRHGVKKVAAKKKGGGRRTRKPEQGCLGGGDRVDQVEGDPTHKQKKGRGKVEGLNSIE